jgi:hypothetical protein
MTTKLHTYLNYGTSFKFASRASKRKGSRDAASALAAERAQVRKIERAMGPVGAYTATPPQVPMAAQLEGRTVADLVRARKAMGLPAVAAQPRYAPGQSPQEVVDRVKAQWGTSRQDIPERFRPVDPVRQRIADRMAQPQEIPERFRARPAAAPQSAPSALPPSAIVHVPQGAPPPSASPSPRFDAAFARHEVMPGFQSAVNPPVRVVPPAGTGGAASGARAASRIPAWLRTPAGMAALGVPAIAGLGYGAYRLLSDDAEKRSSQLSEGARAEAKEHGEHFKELAKQVAADHLKEDPAYYTHLKAMEEGKNPFLRERVRGNG